MYVHILDPLESTLGADLPTLCKETKTPLILGSSHSLLFNHLWVSSKYRTFIRIGCNSS